MFQMNLVIFSSFWDFGGKLLDHLLSDFFKNMHPSVTLSVDYDKHISLAVQKF